jgi:hypothetical protein
MARYFCVECGKLTDHLSVSGTAESIQVTRTTIYNWMRRRQVHWVLRPSGRKLICQESLVTPIPSRSQSAQPGGPQGPRLAAADGRILATAANA